MGLLRFLLSLMGMTKIITASLAFLGAILIQAGIDLKYNWDLHYLNLYQPLQFAAAAGYIIFLYHLGTFFFYGLKLDQKLPNFNWEFFELICCCICCAFGLIGGITGIAVAVKEKNHAYLDVRGVYVQIMVGISLVWISMIPTAIFYLMHFFTSCMRNRTTEYVDT